jgi:hypothetical protein
MKAGDLGRPDREPQDGREAAMLRLHRQLSPRAQCAFRDALLRYVDGQPFARRGGGGAR